MTASGNDAFARLDGIRAGLAHQRHRRLGELAMKRGWIAAAQLQICQGEARPLGEALVSRGWLSKERLQELLQEGDLQQRNAFLNPGPVPIPPEVQALSRNPERTVDQYLLVQEIGEGGSGRVWKAWDRELHRWAAVKFLKVASPQAQRRFVSEARLAAGLSHPHIVTVYGTGIREDQPYITMQYVEGRSSDLVEFDFRGALEVVRDVARAVQFAHERGVVHRDIKPSNIIIDREGRALLTDFGLARHTEGAGNATGKHVALGSAGFMSPEQAAGDGASAGPAIDVFSLGATLYFHCLRTLPFRGRTLTEILQETRAGRIVPPRSIRPDLPVPIERILQRALDEDPAKRYSTAAELAEECDRCLSPRPARASTSWIPWVVLPAVLVAGVVAWGPWQRPPAGDPKGGLQAARRGLIADALAPAVRLLDAWEFECRPIQAQDRITVERSIASARQHDPQSIPAWFEEGRLLWALGRLAEAGVAFDRAAEDPETRLKAIYQRARLGLREYESFRALRFNVADFYNGRPARVVREIRSGAPAELTAIRDQAELDADRFTALAPEGNRDPRSVHLRTLRTFMQAQSPSDYEGLGEELDKPPEGLRVPAWEVHYYRGRALLVARRTGEALRNLERAVSAGLGTCDALTDLGFARLVDSESLRPAERIDAILKSIEEFTRALQQDPTSREAREKRAAAWFRLAEERMSAGRDFTAEFESAIRDLEDKPREAWEPVDYWNVYLFRIRLAELLGGAEAARRLREILDLVQAGVHRHPRNALLWTALGGTRTRLAADKDPKALDAAIAELDEAIRLGPDLATPLCERARALQLRVNLKRKFSEDAGDDVRRGFHDVNRALELEPGNARALMIRGALFHLTREYLQAIRDYEEARALFPQYSADAERLIQSCRRGLGE